MGSVRFMAKVLCVGALGVLTACGFARVPYETGQQSSQSKASCDRSTGVSGQVRVCSGDTLTAMSRTHNVTVLGLMRENGLRNDTIRTGQVLTIPNESVHVVQPGDQLVSIANRYNISSNNLIAANELRRPYTIFPEQRLAIPRGPVNRQVAVRSPSTGTERLPESQPVTNQAPSGPVIIGSGAPPVSTPSADKQEQEQQPQNLPAETTETPPAAEQKTGAAPVPRDRPAEAAKAPAAAVSKPAAKEDAPKKPAAKAKAGFLLPVQGRIVSEFGPKSGGLHNDGLNIAAPRGTPILATADGEIAYAGDGLPGFGNLILIRHDDGWTSAYAHADSMAVKRGDKVQRGGTIGAVGSTGTVVEPQLHFELRKHDRAVDPKPLLGP